MSRGAGKRKQWNGAPGDNGGFGGGPEQAWDETTGGAVWST
jgi:hypothetical protein